MGLIRLLLALSVVLGHSGRIYGYQPFDPARAVQAFYMISGFYMAMVLETKYGPSWAGTKLFWQQRYLRLAPTYWVVLALTVCGVLVLGRRREQFEVLSEMNWPSVLAVVSSNLAIFGQDALMFFGYEPSRSHDLTFATSFEATSFPAARLLFVPQAWTLGVELMFYLWAPLLSRQRSVVLIALGVASFALRIYLYSKGLDHDPWTYRFFPTELVFFLAGMLSFRSYARFHLERLSKKLKLGVLVLVLVMASTIDMTGGAREPLYIFFLVFLALTLPLLFDLTRKLTWDALVGELSYPVYIGHYIFVPFSLYAGRASGLAAAAAALLFGWGLVRLIERPVGRFRETRVRQRTQDAGVS